MSARTTETQLRPPQRVSLAQWQISTDLMDVLGNIYSLIVNRVLIHLVLRNAGIHVFGLHLDTVINFGARCCSTMHETV